MRVYFMCVNICRKSSRFCSAGEFSGSERRKDELMRRRPLLLYRGQLLRRAPLLLGVKQRDQLPVPVPLSGLSDLKRQLAVFLGSLRFLDVQIVEGKMAAVVP